jgi:hypothetical protein
MIFAEWREPFDPPWTGNCKRVRRMLPPGRLKYPLPGSHKPLPATPGFRYNAQSPQAPWCGTNRQGGSVQPVMPGGPARRIVGLFCVLVVRHRYREGESAVRIISARRADKREERD